VIAAPNSWTSTTVGEVTLPIDKHRPEDEPTHEFRYVDISSIDNSSNRVVEPKLVLGRDAPSRARQVVRAGDTVLSTVRTYLKNTAIVPPDLDGATASTGFSVLRPDPDRVEPRFLFYRVLDQGFVERLSEKQTGTSYPAVRDRDVRAMAFSYPALDEQRWIVETIEEQFSRLDAGVESLRRAKRSLPRMRASVLKAATDGGLVESSGGSWETATIRDIAVRLDYGSSAKASADREGVPMLRMGNIQDGRITLDDMKFLPFDHPDT
jgi:type I restriction enzyme S subunit